MPTTKTNWKREKKYYHTNREKTIDFDKNKRYTHKNGIDKLKNKFQNLAQTMEKLGTTISVA